MNLIDTLDQTYTVRNLFHPKQVVQVIAPSREGALLEAARLAYGCQYWDFHPVIVREDYMSLGEFIIYNEGV